MSSEESFSEKWNLLFIKILTNGIQEYEKFYGRISLNISKEEEQNSIYYHFVNRCNYKLDDKIPEWAYPHILTVAREYIKSNIATETSEIGRAHV